MNSEEYPFKEISVGSTVFSGFAFKSNDFTEEGIPVIKIKNVNNRVVDLSETQYFPEIKVTDKHQKFFLKDKDVLIAMTGQGSVGRVGRIRLKNGEIALLNQRVGKFVTDEKNLSQDYLFYVLSSPIYEQILFDTGTGSGQPNLSPKLILQTEIPLPPYNIQRKIGKILSAIDEKIHLNNEINRILEAMGQAIFRHWFVHFEFPDKNGQPYKSSGGEMVDSELGEIPVGWKVGTLADLCELNSNSWTPKTMPEKIYYVDLANTKNGIILDIQVFDATKAPSRAKRILSPGDTIFGTVRPGNRSFTLIGDQNHLTGSTGFAVLTPNDPKLREIVYLITTSEENINRLIHLADGAAYPAVRPNVVTDEICFLPAEQVTKSFHNIIGPLFDLIISNQNEIVNLSKIRDLILPKLMSGKIRVTESVKGV